MTKTKTILTALALTTALTAPVLVVPMLTAPPAIAGQAVVQDLSDLAAKVTPAVVNVAVTMKAGAADEDETHMADRSQQQQMEEFMQRFAERFGQQGQPGGKPQMKPQQRQAQKAQAVGTGFIIDANGWIVTNFHVAGKADSILEPQFHGADVRNKFPAAVCQRHFFLVNLLQTEKKLDVSRDGKMH